MSLCGTAGKVHPAFSAREQVGKRHATSGELAAVKLSGSFRNVRQKQGRLVQ